MVTHTRNLSQRVLSHRRWLSRTSAIGMLTSSHRWLRITWAAVRSPSAIRRLISARARRTLVGCPDLLRTSLGLGSTMSPSAWTRLLVLLIHANWSISRLAEARRVATTANAHPSAACRMGHLLQ